MSKINREKLSESLTLKISADLHTWLVKAANHRGDGNPSDIARGMLQLCMNTFGSDWLPPPIPPLFSVTGDVQRLQAGISQIPTHTPENQ